MPRQATATNPELAELVQHSCHAIRRLRPRAITMASRTEHRQSRSARSSWEISSPFGGGGGMSMFSAWQNWVMRTCLAFINRLVATFCLILSNTARSSPNAGLEASDDMPTATADAGEGNSLCGLSRGSQAAGPHTYRGFSSIYPQYMHLLCCWIYLLGLPNILSNQTHHPNTRTPKLISSSSPLARPKLARTMVRTFSPLHHRKAFL